ncbi:MAG: choice-of-anchor E domain-containing protein [bacterium]
MVSRQAAFQSISSASLANHTADSQSLLGSRTLRALRPVAAALCLLAFAPERTDAGSTDQVHFVRIPATKHQMNFGAPGSNPQAATFDIQVPQFDPALGTLTGVDVELWHNSQVLYRYESVNDNGHDHHVHLHGTSDRLTVTLPSTGRTLISSFGVLPSASPLAPAADGNLDFSDIALSHRMGMSQEPVSGRSVESDSLEAFTGEGSATLCITANSVFELDSRSLSFVYTAAITTGGALQVRYQYDLPQSE